MEAKLLATSGQSLLQEVVSIRKGWRAPQWVGTFAWSLLLCFGLRLTLTLIALICAQLFSLYPACSIGLPRPASPDDTLALFDTWRQWDTCWYERIAAHGYEEGSATVAFFPLYPALMRLVSIPLGGNLALAGPLVSLLAHAGALTILYYLIKRDFNATLARRTIFCLSFFPSAFYFSLPYTESLFLMVVAWSLAAARRGSWVWATVAALLASLTRTQGCLLVLPLVWEVVRQRPPREAHEWRWLWRIPLVSVLPIVGMVLFLFYSKLATGWTTLQVQSAYWGVTYQPPWETFQESLQFIQRTGALVERYNLVLLIGALIIFLVGLRHLPLTYSLYTAPNLLLMTARKVAIMPLNSTSRYLLVLFPLFVLIAMAMAHRRLRLLWVLLSSTVTIILLVLFLLGVLIA